MALFSQGDSTITVPKVLVSAFPIHATGALGRTLELIINQTLDVMTPFVFFYLFIDSSWNRIQGLEHPKHAIFQRATSNYSKSM